MKNNIKFVYLDILFAKFRFKYERRTRAVSASNIHTTARTYWRTYTLVRAKKHTYIHTYTHTYARTNTHTHTHSLAPSLLFCSFSRCLYDFHHDDLIVSGYLMLVTDDRDDPDLHHDDLIVSGYLMLVTDDRDNPDQIYTKRLVF